MNILIVAATIPEVLPFINRFKLKEKNKIFSGAYNNFHINLLITGIGMVATTYNLTKTITSYKYDIAINVGIAGSFNKSHTIGEVVNVVEDKFSELGAEDGEHFVSLNNLNIEPHNIEIIANPLLNFPKTLDLLKKVKGITVNTVHGNKKSIDNIIKIDNPDIETMEGAAFMYVCLSENMKFIQLRAISNLIEKRKKENWNVPLAIKNLNNILLSVFQEKFL